VVPIGVKHFNISSPKAMSSQHVVDLLDVVMMTWSTGPPVPPSGDQERLVANIERSTGGGHQVMSRRTSLGVLLEMVTHEFGIVDGSCIRTRRKPRDVGATNQQLTPAFVCFQINGWQKVDFAAFGKVSTALSTLQSVAAAAFQRQQQTFTTYGRLHACINLFS
jgi:hypothetical protein